MILKRDCAVKMLITAQPLACRGDWSHRKLSRIELYFKDLISCILLNVND